MNDYFKNPLGRIPHNLLARFVYDKARVRDFFLEKKLK
jgi:hypothetical protein